jgi:hypothetical protein
MEDLLQLILITRDPDFAQASCAAGVNRIMVDLEVLGKEARQRGRNMVMNGHRREDVARLRPAVPTGGLMARVNPLHSDSRQEIDAVIAAGADYVMLPMFRFRAEVEQFISLMSGRAKTVLLLETPEARSELDQILSVAGIDEIHVGLNDLSLGLGMPFLFQVLAEGIIDEIAEKVRRAEIRFGFGGVGRMNGDPLPGHLIIAEHKRVGSEMVILSRSFHGDSKTLAQFEQTGIDLQGEIAGLRAVEQRAAGRSQAQIERDRRVLQRKVQEIVGQLTTTEALTSRS